MIIQQKRRDDTVHVIAVGRVTKDAEVKTTKNGKEKVKFSFAFADKDYMNVEAWGDSHQGQVAAALEKGDQIFVAGTVRSWEYNGKTYTSLDAEFVATQEAILRAMFQQSPETTASYAEDGVQYGGGGGSWEELEDSDEEPPF